MKQDVKTLLDKKAPLTRKEEEILFSCYEKHPSQDFRNAIVVKNMGLVRKLSLKYQNLGIDLEELRQEGVFGLMTAIDRFDYKRGFKFSTYAYYWINQSIIRYLMNHRHTIRLPVYLAAQYLDVEMLQKEYLKEHGEYPSDTYISEKTDFTLEKVKELSALHLKTSPVSLHALMLKDEESSQWMTTTEDTKALEELEAADRQMDMERLWCIMESVLTEKELFVISLRFGLKDRHARTQSEIGEMLGVTRGRVQQIEQKALGKLKNLRKLRHLRDLKDYIQE